MQNLTASVNEHTPIKQASSDITSSQPSSNSSFATSPHKSPKERLMAYSPRRRLFSRAEEEYSTITPTSHIRPANVPPRDKSGLRSSSETSVFDFPDSDSETEMSALQKQSLEDMRRDRKLAPKMLVNDDDIEVPYGDEPRSLDSAFDEACNSFMEQLKKGVGKKRGRRKKVDSDVLIKLEETVTKDKPGENENVKVDAGDEIGLVKVKIEVEDYDESRDGIESTENSMNVERIKIEGGIKVENGDSLYGDVSGSVSVIDSEGKNVEDRKTIESRKLIENKKEGQENVMENRKYYLQNKNLEIRDLDCRNFESKTVENKNIENGLHYGNLENKNDMESTNTTEYKRTFENRNVLENRNLNEIKDKFENKSNIENMSKVEAKINNVNENKDLIENNFESFNEIAKVNKSDIVEKPDNKKKIENKKSDIVEIKRNTGINENKKSLHKNQNKRSIEITERNEKRTKSEYKAENRNKIENKRDRVGIKERNKKERNELKYKTEKSKSQKEDTNIEIKKEPVDELDKEVKEKKDDSDSDVPLSKCKKAIDDDSEEEVLIRKEKVGARIKIESDSESYSETESERLTCSSKTSKDKAVKKESHNVDLTMVVKPGRKPNFGDGNAFQPGWEEELYKYKKSCRMPASLIHVTRPPNCQRLSTSLPDLDPCPISPTSSSVTETECSKLKVKSRNELIDSDIDSNCSFNFSFNKSNYDSEEGSSVKSLPFTTKREAKEDSNKEVEKKGGILDRLLERYVGKKRKKPKKKESENGPKIIPKSENPQELLPTPSLELDSSNSAQIIKDDSALLGFRKKTIDNFKDAFIKNSSSIVGVNEQFTTVVLKSRTRTETRVLKQKATIREVFGEDRPASAPPVTCVDDIKKDEGEDKLSLEDLLRSERVNKIEEVGSFQSKLAKKYKKPNNLLKELAAKKIKTEFLEDCDLSKDTDLSKDADLSKDVDTKSETPSLEGDENSVPSKKKYRNMRRKFSSGFDYIRKKKKVKNTDSDVASNKTKGRRVFVSKANIESVQDIHKEIKTWVLNKGIGETHLHRAARLGYTVSIDDFFFSNVNHS